MTKTLYRFLHTLISLGTSRTQHDRALVTGLPRPFRYCASMSIKTDSIQYENDDLMRPMYGDGMPLPAFRPCVGKDMQFFGPGQLGQSPALCHQRRL